MKDPLIITIPVIVSYKEELIESTNIVIKLFDNYLDIQMNCIKESPVDDEDNYSSKKKWIIDRNIILKKSSITGMELYYNNNLDLYEIEITVETVGYPIAFEDKHSAISFRSILITWLFN